MLIDNLVDSCHINAHDFSNAKYVQTHTIKFGSDTSTYTMNTQIHLKTLTLAGASNFLKTYYKMDMLQIMQETAMSKLPG